MAGTHEIDQSVANRTTNTPGCGRDFNLGRVGEQCCFLRPRFAPRARADRQFDRDPEAPWTTTFDPAVMLRYKRDTQGRTSRGNGKLCLCRNCLSPCNVEFRVEIKRRQRERIESPRVGRPLARVTACLDQRGEATVVAVAVQIRGRCSLRFKLGQLICQLNAAPCEQCHGNRCSGNRHGAGQFCSNQCCAHART